MKELSKYNIAIQGLEDHSYEYVFEGGSAFFAAFEQDLIKKGHFVAKLKLDKSATMIQVRFDISGTIELICDRTLEPFEEPFQSKEKYIYKFGERFEELTEEIAVIPFGTAMINIAQQIFEFIAVEIPMKKLHPRFRNEDDSVGEILIYSTESKVVDNQSVNDETPQAIDPRWAVLSKLKVNNN